MRYKEKYDLWLNSDLVDEKTKFELKNIDENEIKDRFYKDLDFGYRWIKRNYRCRYK